MSRGKAAEAATGVEEGAAGRGATFTAHPHSLQNFASADSACPHWLHWRRSAVPQASQNLAACEFGWLQCGHSMAASVRPPGWARKSAGQLRRGPRPRA
jgi:hypothetical protein